MEDSWLNQPASLSGLRLRENLDEEATSVDRRQLVFEQALRAISARLDLLAAQLAEVRAAVGLPVEEPPAGSERGASAGWDS